MLSLLFPGVVRRGGYKLKQRPSRGAGDGCLKPHHPTRLARSSGPDGGMGRPQGAGVVTSDEAAEQGRIDAIRSNRPPLAIKSIERSYTHMHSSATTNSPWWALLA